VRKSPYTRKGDSRYKDGEGGLLNNSRSVHSNGVRGRNSRSVHSNGVRGRNSLSACSPGGNPDSASAVKKKKSAEQKSAPQKSAEQKATDRESYLDALGQIAEDEAQANNIPFDEKDKSTLNADGDKMLRVMDNSKEAKEAKCLGYKGHVVYIGGCPVPLTTDSYPLLMMLMKWFLDQVDILNHDSREEVEWEMGSTTGLIVLFHPVKEHEFFLKELLSNSFIMEDQSDWYTKYTKFNQKAVAGSTMIIEASVMEKIEQNNGIPFPYDSFTACLFMR